MTNLKENSSGLIPFSREEVKVGDRLFRLNEFGYKESFEDIIVDYIYEDYIIGCILYDSFLQQKFYKRFAKRQFEINKRYINRTIPRYKRLFILF